MEEAVELAGLLAAHAVWCVADGEVLVPLVGMRLPDGTTTMLRFVADQLEDGVAQARERLAANPEGATSGVLIYDGFVTLPTGKTDALIIEAHRFGPQVHTYSSVVPYRNAASPGGFAVFRPKIVRVSLQNPDFDALVGAFFRGVDQHEKDARVWADHIDQSQ